MYLKPTKQHSLGKINRMMRHITLFKKHALEFIPWGFM
jgi:hypothetical protein